MLLEFMLMIALKSHAESSVQAIYPVLLGARNADGSFAEFPLAELQRLRSRRPPPRRALKSCKFNWSYYMAWY